MRHKRKWIIVTVVAATMVLAGLVGGVVYAQTGTTQTNNNPNQTLLAKVATILGIDQQKVEDAFAQAQKETQDEALSNQLESLVEQGKITQEQADQYKQWWQSRPDVPVGLDSRGGIGDHRGFGMPGLEGNEPPASPTTTPQKS